MLNEIENLRAEAVEAIGSADDPKQLEELRITYLGRNSRLTEILRGIGSLDPADRGPVGSTANKARQEIETLLNSRKEAVEAAALNESLAAGALDVTLPGRRAVDPGHLHILTQTRREIEDIFIGLGYGVIEGPEIEHDHYNFTALNHPPDHPARMLQDTFYVDPESLHIQPPPGPRDVVLRTHTSPMQVRTMESRPSPIFIIVPGRVYRRDSDATHTPMFHQIEGLALAPGITLADLRGTLLEFATAIFGEGRETRLRPHYFPFTEPSVEVDVSCFKCDRGTLPEGGRCPLCKGTGWLEILGAGMVDPNVFGWVQAHDHDPATSQGFAFGMGIERIAMLKHGVPDLRLFYENDIRFLEQF